MEHVELVKAEIGIEEQVEAKGVADILANASSRSLMSIEEHTAWPVLSQLPLPVSAEIPLAGFKVSHLLTLEAGHLVESTWSESEDIRVIAAGVQAAWSEFEVEEQKLLVRLTRLA